MELDLDTFAGIIAAAVVFLLTAYYVLRSEKN